MFSIYLPIAEMPVNALFLLGLGGVAGILSGMFGIGGGFLMTPILMFIGVPPPVAVATSANQIIAASFSGFIAHWRKQNVDILMGNFLLVGGLVGSTIGVWIFKRLQEIGQIDLVISLTYVFFLSFIGLMMLWESGRVIFYKRRNKPIPARKRKRWAEQVRLPLKMHFPRSDVTVSALLPLMIGVVVGMMVSIMGIGGGFFMIPAMIYLLGMPTSVVIGTSLFQIIFTTANVTILQAVNTQTVDIVLAMLLMVGSVIGAQYGTRWGVRIAAEKLRILLALMVLAVTFRLGLGLFLEPDQLYTVIVEEVM